jgi:hypothetical protein
VFFLARRDVSVREKQGIVFPKYFYVDYGVVAELKAKEQRRFEVGLRRKSACQHLRRDI